MTTSAMEFNALIVGSDAQTFLRVREHLQRAGFRVRGADNGWDALKSVKETPPDIVVAEITMPDMDGCSLRERFMLDPGMRDIPFIFLTEDGGAERQIRALRAGVDDYIVKPCDPIVVVARVEAVLSRRRTYEELVRVDPLTRLLNRPSVEMEVREELARLIRYRHIACLAVIDVDDLASINKEHGHPMGDLMLTCLGGIILSNVRSVDIAGRLRGEEFVLYLPETNAEGAHTLLSRIHDRFVASADAIAGIPASFTAGIAEAPAAGQDWPSLYAKAMKALQDAKERGRGEIVMAEITESAV